MQKMMMVVPVDADVNEAQDIAKENRATDRKAATPVPCGGFISRTMIVIMTASTPSLKASSRPFLILLVFPLCV
jgi:hypothetical protein